MQKETTIRLGKGANFYQNMKHLVWDKQIPNKANITKFKTSVIPIIMNGFKARNVTDKGME